MRHPIESAAWFFRRGDFVLGNDVLKDECGVEYKRPGQARQSTTRFTEITRTQGLSTRH